MRKLACTLCLIFGFAAIISTTTQCRKKEKNIFSQPFVSEVMKKVCDWQLQNPVAINASNENDWARAAFYTGVMATYRTTQEKRYLDAAIKWSESLDWKLANRLRHADDHSRGQTFLEIYEIMKEPKMVADVKSTFDSLIADPKPGREDWWWCDALFMAPPVLARLAAATGDNRYLEFLNTMFWDTYDFLYDREEHLFFRDASYFNKRTPNGSKTFWARGNGWVMAGTARVLQYLPSDDPFRDRYVSLLKEMAATVKRIQGEDGLWRPSLLDPEEVPHPETSGSSFFCYALAWGINNGLLNEKEYLPVVKKAWQGLNSWVTEEGKLQWVQPIGAAPDKVTMDNYQEYGSGAFLLAGSEVYKLKGEP
ncbi:MAG: glycoside hydrolase family 88 protein [candidate division KSB1 bacterium]|nr:glycoside hydrolase family 88 protein [candidate division KSB1 bacterium]MDZ7304201.1 glycoside hydrolase family 88 protein [candidate division KSB1 bacterium]MDZ7313429.1 glycoside hydrolase family 88 protein [candidate division KSB1 bacterium]